MASWTLPYRVDPVDRDPGGFFWQDLEDMPPDDSTDFFGAFVDFDDGGANTLANPEEQRRGSMSMSVSQIPPGSLLLDHPPESIGSSGVSTSDELDFLSSSSQAGAAASAASSHEIDPRDLSLSAHAAAMQQQHIQSQEVSPHHQLDNLGRGSMSETELQRLEEISLRSPTKNVSTSQPSSPTPPSTVNKTARKSNKIVEALSSTIRKATNRRKPRKALPPHRAASPTVDNPPKALRHKTGNVGAPPSGKIAVSSPVRQQAGGAEFIHGFCDDPFGEGSQGVPMRYYSQNGVMQASQSQPGVKNEAEMIHTDPLVQANGAWPLGANGEPWAGAGEYGMAPHEQGWWDLNVFQPHQRQPNGSGSSNNGEYELVAQHARQAAIQYEYAPIPDTSAAGLMIHMPQPRPAQPSVVHDISLNAQTYLPPPNHQQQQEQITAPPMPQAPATDRPHRPPRAKSSGARHMSCSPMRKTRAPSASPTRNTPARSRHSSGGSVSSVRSASGRLPGSMPGTPCSVRKRRSRDISGGGGSAPASTDIGFVNFTPSDGGMLMTGVAPSGSSKTKARREKEAMDRRRRMSEAAMKAVAAAGGDIDKLVEQGFEF